MKNMRFVLKSAILSVFLVGFVSAASASGIDPARVKQCFKEVEKHNQKKPGGEMRISLMVDHITALQMTEFLQNLTLSFMGDFKITSFTSMGFEDPSAGISANTAIIGVVPEGKFSQSSLQYLLDLKDNPEVLDVGCGFPAGPGTQVGNR